MARSTFGGRPGDFTVVDPLTTSNVVNVAPSQTGGTVWSASTGGTQYTDPLVAGSPTTTVTTDTRGRLNPFQGPDGVNVGVWVGFGGGSRVLLDPQTTPPTVRANVIDVRDYGALFNNSTNDTAAIQAALDAAVVSVTGLSGNDLAGAIVQMPPGRAKVTQLQMPSNVWLRGTGPSGTYLVTTSTTLDTIVLKTGNEVQCTLSDFGIIGNGASQTAGAGINLNQTGGSSILGDSRHVVRDVVIADHYRGVSLLFGTEVRLHRVTVQRPKEKGIASTSTDSFISDCTVAQPGDIGFDIQGGNTRLWGCKAFGGGSGVWNTFGFNIGGSGRHEVSTCEVQDFNGSGFQIDGGYGNVLSSCLVDSCNFYGFHFATVNTGSVDGAVVLRPGGAYTPDAAVNLEGYSYFGNRIRVDCQGTFPRYRNASGTTTGSEVVIDRMLGTQTITYAASITPNVYTGGRVYVGTLTGNITINNPDTTLGAAWPVGTRLQLMLTQDATGGRTYTWGGNYQLTGGALGTTASTTYRIEFEWNDTKWREVSRS